MNHLETEYLKRNHFHLGTEGRFVANVIQDFKFVEDGFCDKRQLLISSVPSLAIT